MREILFRGKTDRDLWVYGSLIKTGNYCCILPDDDGSDYEYPYLDSDLGTIDGQATPVRPETVGQFTGLCDKNGNKIFEGDIVRDNDGEMEIVKFVDGRYYYPFVASYDHLWWDEDECEVISNIHDNPELVEEKL